MIKWLTNEFFGEAMNVEFKREIPTKREKFLKDIIKKVKGYHNMNDKIKVLFLDIDNTLLDFDAAAAWAMEQCFQKAGLEYKSEMFAAFTEENNKIWQRIERKELTMDDLFYVRWQAILGHLGLEADGVEMEKEFVYFST